MEVEASPEAAIANSLNSDAWLSSLLGRPCYHLRLNTPLAKDDRTARLMSALAQDGVFIDAKLPVDRLDLTADLEARGFHLIDTAVRLARPVRREAATKITDVAVRAAAPPDRFGVESLARRAFHTSRFHADPRIAPDKADDIKARWAGNYFNGTRGDYMMVAEAAGDIVGFVQLLAPDNGLLVIDLIAVQASHRGRGIAAAMIWAAECGCGHPARLAVGTQLANTASIALYQRDGFQLADARYVFHYHGARNRP